MTAENADGGDSCGSVTDSEDERMKDKESFREFAHLLCECYDCRSSLNAVSADQISHGRRPNNYSERANSPMGVDPACAGAFPGLTDGRGNDLNLVKTTQRSIVIVMRN